MALSLKAGTDLNCGSYFRLHLKDAFDQGLVTMEDIDQALLRIFVTRIKLGVFDPPSMNPYSKISKDVVDSKPHKELAHEIALQSIVLLKNENDVLPLQKTLNQLQLLVQMQTFADLGHIQESLQLISHL